MSGIPLLPPTPVTFPNPTDALAEPDGLVAAGGDLTIPWLLTAYANGIFPWFDSDDDHVLWWSPSQRAVLRPGKMIVRRSLAKRIRNGGFDVRMDTCFDDIISACGETRTGAEGTWITSDMRAAYGSLHAAGYAHSVEVFLNGELCGGLYGVSIGHMFFGESMFSAAPDASKVALFHLQQQLAAWEFTLIDCQILNPHLESLGVATISRDDFLQQLVHNDQANTRRGIWRFD